MKEITKSTRIGWIGTGVMGASMCDRIVSAGYQNVSIYTRTKSKATALIEKGCRWCSTPSEVTQNSDILFTIVGYPEDVEAVYFGKDGIFEGIQDHTLLIDMTTTRPSLAKKIYDAAVRKNASSIDAPVSGGDVGARNGGLSIMTGGLEDDITYAMPLLSIMGKNIVYQGVAGSGQHTKMCNQIAIAGTMIGVCESLLYAHKSGLDATTVLQSIGGGAAACWTLDNLAPRIIDRNFDPGFYVEHFVKDMEIALDACREMNISLPGLALVHQLYRAVMAQGHGRKGTQALSLALEGMSGM